MSDLWKQVDGDRKVLWEDKAEKDKARYKKEMERYTPPPDSEDTDDSDDDAKGKKPKAKRAKKDPNAPKRPMNAYILYSNSIRSKVREENPDLAMGEIVSSDGPSFASISGTRRTDHRRSIPGQRDRNAIQSAQRGRERQVAGEGGEGKGDLQ